MSACSSAQPLSSSDAAYFPCIAPVNDVSTEELFQEGVKFYEEGDYTKAADRFTKAADLKFAAAQFWLGGMCIEGTGVPMDIRMGVDLVKDAANQNHPEAMHIFGNMCEKGYGGVPQSYEEALKWYRKAGKMLEPGALTDCIRMVVKMQHPTTTSP